MWKTNEQLNTYTLTSKKRAGEKKEKKKKKKHTRKAEKKSNKTGEKYCRDIFQIHSSFILYDRHRVFQNFLSFLGLKFCLIYSS